MGVGTGQRNGTPQTPDWSKLRGERIADSFSSSPELGGDAIVVLSACGGAASDAFIGNMGSVMGANCDAIRPSLPGPILKSLVMDMVSATA